jgi:tetratricopeptide (TPR) repeat protein
VKRETALFGLAATVAHGVALGAAAALVARSAAGGRETRLLERIATLEARLSVLERTGDENAVQPPAAAPVEEAVFPRQRAARSYLDEGNVYCAVSQWERAAERFTRALEVEPELGAALYNRAVAFARLGNHTAALADYNRAATLDPDDADVFNNRGLLLLELGEPERASADFERAAELDPASSEPLVNLGQLLLDAGEPDAALVRFQAASRRVPDDPAIFYGAALALVALARLPEADAALQRALQLNPALAGEAAGDPRLAALTVPPAEQD